MFKILKVFSDYKIIKVDIIYNEIKFVIVGIPKTWCKPISG